MYLSYYHWFVQNSHPTIFSTNYTPRPRSLSLSLSLLSLSITLSFYTTNSHPHILSLPLSIHPFLSRVHSLSFTLSLKTFIRILVLFLPFLNTFVQPSITRQPVPFTNLTAINKSSSSPQVRKQCVPQANGRNRYMRYWAATNRATGSRRFWPLTTKRSEKNNAYIELGIFLIGGGGVAFVYIQICLVFKEQKYWYRARPFPLMCYR